MFRQDSERRQSKISHVTVSKKGSVCKNEVAQKKVGHVLVLSARQGAMMERPSLKPSSSIAVHYIHWPWRRDPLSSDGREGWDASSSQVVSKARQGKARQGREEEGGEQLLGWPPSTLHLYEIKFQPIKRCSLYPHLGTLYLPPCVDLLATALTCQNAKSLCGRFGVPFSCSHIYWSIIYFQHGAAPPAAALIWLGWKEAGPPLVYRLLAEAYTAPPELLILAQRPPPAHCQDTCSRSRSMQEPWGSNSS